MNRNNSVKYCGTYTDDFGTADIVIYNDFKKLTLKIDDVEFKGSEFTALEIANKELYTNKQLERFSFCKSSSESGKFVGQICNCLFDITVPQLIIDLKTFKQIPVCFNLNYNIGKERAESMRGGIEFEKIRLALKISDKVYEAEGDLFETVLENTQNQFDGKYRLKNCFGCLYSDYSVYGQSALGSMRCFVNKKDKYLEVKSKKEYMEKLNDDYEVVQEIFCCEKFEIRRKGTGYRG